MNRRAQIKALQAGMRELQTKLEVEECWTEKYRNLWLQALTAAARATVPQTVKPTESLVEQANAADPICCYCQKPKRLVRVTP